MGIGSSSSSPGKGTDSDDADVQFVDRHTRFRTKVDQAAAISSQNSPLASSNPDQSSSLMGTSLSPQGKVTQFSDSPIVSYVKRDEQSELWKTDYSPTAMKSKRTSPCSYKMTSEAIIAFPSPSNLHSPPLSYTRKFNETSPIKPKEYPSPESIQDEQASSYRGRMSNLFYSSMPSPTWKPLSRGASRTNSLTSLTSCQSWGQRTSSWDGLSTDNCCGSGRADHGYYYDETDDFYLQSAKEKRYF